MSRWLLESQASQADCRRTRYQRGLGPQESHGCAAAASREQQRRRSRDCLRRQAGEYQNYYYQETAVSRAGVAADDSPASDNHEKLEGAIGERLLINRYGPLATIAGIVLVAVGSIIGVTLMIDAAQGMYQLWKALGY